MSCYHFLQTFRWKIRRPCKATHIKVTPRKGSGADPDKEFRTQIQRAMRDLDIELIFAGSLQGKGYAQFMKMFS
jgi:hypothetical protein